MEGTFQIDKVRSQVMLVEVMDDVKNIATINYHEDMESIKEIEEPK